MRTVTVPEDMSSEQKVILGILSFRQLIYLAMGLFLIGSYVPGVFSFLAKQNIVIALIGSVVSAVPVLVIILPLALLKKRKYHMYYDKYLLLKLYKRSQTGVWRKGEYSKTWMDEKLK
ncbi:PrgI family mobile element protein [Pontibacillus halophilus]|uniref:PrgI family mobile element protein n=1 Tax=Pontibacillus halophilus TaxID=516704 RepID=UPI00047AB77C|nr:PrgI family protein [Pontibacillus halophilus]